MAVKTPASPGPSRFSILGKGLGFRTQRFSPRMDQQATRTTGEDEWYIPYNGPYEPPQQPSPDGQTRDSWGNVLEERGDEHIVGDDNLRGRYDYGPPPDENRLSQRTRVMSNISGRTMSSGTVDPGRGNGSTRRSTVAHTHTHAHAPPLPSYVDLDGSGGIGESPSPRQHASSPTRSPGTKSGFAQFLFGNNGSKKPQHPNSSPGASWSAAARALSSPLPSPPASAKTSFSETRYQPELHHEKIQTTLHDDPYHSHYPAAPASAPPIPPVKPQFHHIDSTDLLRTSKSRHHQLWGNVENSSHPLPPPPPPESSARFSPPPHPYAYAFPSVALLSPPEKHTDPASAPLDSKFPLGGLRQRTLHSSLSTPNLRRNKPLPSLRKGKDKWFSAETWCDALFLPRPRFRMTHDSPSSAGSGRIVSPPDSPVFPDEKGAYPGQTTGFESRVLAHSRSMADLRLTREREADPPPVRRIPDGFESRAGTLLFSPSQLPTARTEPESHHHHHIRTLHKEEAPLPSPPPPPPPPVPAKDDRDNTDLQRQQQQARPPRPKSFALDDLALPSPIPSLSTVLEEGRQLEQQRRQWQAQASHSFQNHRTRTIGRGRSKSVGTKKKETAVDVIKERSFLGSQGVRPTVVITEPKGKDSSHKDSTSFGRISHSHKSSLAKTVSSKSTRSHQTTSQTHSRSDSWGKSALKMAKNTAAFCGFGNDPTVSPLDEHNAGVLENALERDEAMRARHPDQDMDRTNLSPTNAIMRNSMSPTPSGVSDSQVGIAISTPPPEVAHRYNVEPVRFTAHPFAQGAVYSYAQREDDPDVQEATQGSTYAGPHPIIKHDNNSDVSSDYIVRRRQVPPTSLHPYAAAGGTGDDSRLVAYPRFDSNVSPSSKMWAQLRPGVLEEILPDELQYSPAVSAHLINEDESRRDNEKRLRDRVSIGEALSYAMNKRISRDSGLGTSEDQYDPSNPVIEEEHIVESVPGNLMKKNSARRKPVQYDVLHPIHQSHSSSPPPSHLTIGSSILDASAQGLAPANDRQDSSGSSPGVTSQASSPPHSPPPLGNYDDLDAFRRDIFYRPNTCPGPQVEIQPIVSPSNSIRTRRTASRLTTLARQLSQDLEDLRASQSLRSRPSESSETPGSESIKDLHFILEGDYGTPSGVLDTPPLRLPEHKIQAFQPSGNLPEDVESSRASSPLEGLSEDDHAAFRFGTVEAVSTPPAVSSSNYRLSQRLSYVDEHDEFVAQDFQTHATPRPPPQPIMSRGSLQPPPTPFNRSSSSGLTRSSVMTTSTSLSRMSGLSDFPQPPEHTLTPAHMSILNAFFDENPAAAAAMNRQQSQDSQDSLSETNPQQQQDDTSTYSNLPPMVEEREQRSERNRRFTFGADDSQNISDSLSTHP